MRLQVLTRILPYFNSIKVRLKQSAQIMGNSISRFQFHKGTIKTFLNIRIAIDTTSISIP